jgi:CRISPR system Cascade subunit CasD
MRMSTLLLRLAGPLQSWGYDSKFETRRTGKEPSKSGVIGLLAAALGRKRDDPIDDLAQLRFGVRVDKEGELLHDYHTAQMVSGKTYVTHRYYLSDATFLVGLESNDEAWLDMLQQALLHPAFPLFLGRRSCVPVLPIVVGIRSSGLIEALREEPWQLTSWMQKKETKKGHYILRLITDAFPDDRSAAVQKDLPVTFHPENRRYAYRPVKEHSPVIIHDFLPEETIHDAMGEL